jgi:hypothetical protein
MMLDHLDITGYNSTNERRLCSRFRVGRLAALAFFEDAQPALVYCLQRLYLIAVIARLDRAIQ